MARSSTDAKIAEAGGMIYVLFVLTVAGFASMARANNIARNGEAAGLLYSMFNL